MPAKLKALIPLMILGLQPIFSGLGKERHVVFANPQSNEGVRRAVHDLKSWHPEDTLAVDNEGRFPQYIQGIGSIRGRAKPSVDIDLETASPELIFVWAHMMGWTQDKEPTEEQARQFAKMLKPAELKIANKWLDTLYAPRVVVPKPSRARKASGFGGALPA